MMEIQIWYTGKFLVAKDPEFSPQKSPTPKKKRKLNNGNFPPGGGGPPSPNAFGEY